MKNCASCTNKSCGGCRGLTLTPEELDLLQLFREEPFLPLARSAGGETPVFIRDGGEVVSDSLTWLMLKGLITLDYDIPLQDFDYAGYEKYPVRGSMALTRRGQEALDYIDIQGVSE